MCIARRSSIEGRSQRRSVQGGFLLFSLPRMPVEGRLRDFLYKGASCSFLAARANMQGERESDRDEVERVRETSIGKERREVAMQLLRASEEDGEA